jgi:hypothetical protein
MHIIFFVIRRTLKAGSDAVVQGTSVAFREDDAFCSTFFKKVKKGYSNE